VILPGIGDTFCWKVQNTLLFFIREISSSFTWKVVADLLHTFAFERLQMTNVHKTANATKDAPAQSHLDLKWPMCYVLLRTSTIWDAKG